VLSKGFCVAHNYTVLKQNSTTPAVGLKRAVEQNRARELNLAQTAIEAHHERLSRIIQIFEKFASQFGLDLLNFSPQSQM